MTLPDKSWTTILGHAYLKGFDYKLCKEKLLQWRILKTKIIKKVFEGFCVDLNTKKLCKFLIKN